MTSGIPLIATVTVETAAIVGFGVVAFVVARAKADPRLKRPLLVNLLVMAIWQLSLMMATLARTAETAALWYHILVFLCAGWWVATFYHFVERMLGSPKRTLVTVGYGLATATSLFGLAVVMLPIERLQFEIFMGDAGFFIPTATPAAISTVAWVPAIWSYGLYRLVRAYFAERSRYRKNRIAYLLLGSLLMIVGSATNATPLQHYPVDVVFSLLYALVFGVAVFRHRLLAVRTVLVRDVSYWVVMGAFLGQSLFAILWLETLLRDFFVYPGHLTTMLLTALLAGFLLFAWSRLQVHVDRFFHRHRYDHQEALSAFSRAVASVSLPDAISGRIVTTVQDAFVPDRVLLFIAPPEEQELRLQSHHGFSADPPRRSLIKNSALVHQLAETRAPIVRDDLTLRLDRDDVTTQVEDLLETDRMAVLVPLASEQDLTGLIALGDKKSGDAYGDEDLSFVVALATHASVALDNAFLLQRLERLLAQQAAEIGTASHALDTQTSIRRTAEERITRYVTELRELNEKMTTLAHRDTLTELPNRLLFYDRLEQAVRQAHSRNEMFGLMFVDLDKLKELNDKRGHEAGDVVLQELGRRLRASVKESDTVARLGGDEFTVIATGINGPDDVEGITKGILAAMQHPFVVFQGEESMSCSIGIALYPADGATGEVLMRHADTAMYAAKAAARGGYRFYARL